MKNIIQLAFVKFLDIPYRIKYLNIYFPIDTTKWSIDAMFCIYGAWPILFFFLAVRILIKLRTIQNKKADLFEISRIILFTCLWSYGPGAIIGGLIFNFGLGYLSSWLYFNDTIELLISFLLLSLIPLGVSVMQNQLNITNRIYSRRKNISLFKGIESYFFFSSLAINIPLGIFISKYFSATYLLPIISIQFFAFIQMKEYIKKRAG